MKLGQLMKQLAALWTGKPTTPVRHDLTNDEPIAPETPVSAWLVVGDRVMVNSPYNDSVIEYGWIVAIDDTQELVHVLFENDDDLRLDASRVQLVGA